MVHHKLVHPLGQAIETCAGIAQYCLRCFEALPGLQHLAKVCRIDALHHTGKPLLGKSCRGIVIAGINQVEAVNSACILAGFLLTEQKAGIVLIGRCTGGTFIDHAAHAHSRIAALHLCDPAAVEGCHGIAAV